MNLQHERPGTPAAWRWPSLQGWWGVRLQARSYSYLLYSPPWSSGTRLVMRGRYRNLTSAPRMSIASDTPASAPADPGPERRAQNWKTTS